LGNFFEIDKGYLFVYYVGHGTSIEDQDGSELDNEDEVFVFDDGYVTDDILI
jgi:hypothetical protein